MAGTLSATIAIGQAVNAAHAGNGALAAQTIERRAAAAGLTGAGALDVASILARYDRAMALTGSGVLAALPKQIYTTPVGLAGAGALTALGKQSSSRDANLLSDGVLSATAAKYVPPVITPDAGGGTTFSSLSSGTALSISWSQTVAADANLAMVGIIGKGGSTGTLTVSVTFGGVAMTLADSRLINTFPATTLSIYKLKNPPTGLRTVNVTANLSAATSTRGIAGWGQTYKNADADNINATSAGNGGNNGNPQTTTTPVAVPVGGYSFSIYARTPLAGQYTSSDGTLLYAPPYTGLSSAVAHKQGAGAVLTTTVQHNTGSCGYGDLCCVIPPFT